MVYAAGRLEVLVVVVLLTAPFFPPVLADGSTAVDDLEDHDAIVIVGDEGPTGFILARNPVTGAPVYRPGSGVVAGDGVPGDPFVIEGWRTPSVTLIGTTAHVVVRHNEMTSAWPLRGSPVLLREAANATVHDNALRGGTWNVRVVGGGPLLVEANDLEGARNGGVRIQESHDVVILGNRIRDTHTGVHVERSSGNTLAGNRFDGVEDGIYLEDSHGNAIRANHLTDVVAGVQLVRSHRNEVAGNAIARDPTGFFLYGIFLWGASDNRLEANEITATRSWAIEIQGGLGNRVAENAIGHVEVNGIRLSGTRNATVVNNSLLGAGDGVETWASPGTVVSGNAFGRQAYLVIGEASDRSVVDGNTLDGGSIEVERSENVAVRDNLVHDAYVGISIEHARAHLEGNNLTGNTWGAWIWASDGSVVTGNRIAESFRAGLEVFRSRDVEILENAFESNGWADLESRASRNLRIEGNELTGGGLVLRGGHVDDYRHAIDATNRVNGRVLAYVRDAENVTVPPGAGQVVVVNSSNVVVDAPRIGNVTAGVQLHHTRGVHVAGGEIRDTRWAIRSDRSTDLLLNGTSLTENSLGVFLLDARNVTVQESRITDNAYAGLFLDFLPGSGLRLLRNDVLRNGDGVNLQGGAGHLFEANEIAFNGDAGIHLFGGVEDAILRGNNLHGNGWGALDAGGAVVDAEQNWWGCAEGPMDPACDEVAGDVDYDPWLTAPAENAGA